MARRAGIVTIAVAAGTSKFRTDLGQAKLILRDFGQAGRRAGEDVAGGLAVATTGTRALVKAAGEAALAVEGIVLAVGHYSTAAVAGGSATENLVNGWRALRVALNPTVFTASTVALGILTEETVRLTLARARLIEQQSLIAAQTGLPIRSVQAIDTIASIAGDGANANTIRSLQSALQARSASDSRAVGSGLEMLGISGSAKDPDILAKIATGFSSIEDPARRAEAAVRLFGKDDAAEALQQLTGRFAAAYDAVNRFGLGLNATARTQIYQFRRDILSLADPFVFLEENVKAARSAVGLGGGSRVLLLCTEGATDPEAVLTQADVDRLWRFGSRCHSTHLPPRFSIAKTHPFWESSECCPMNTTAPGW